MITGPRRTFHPQYHKLQHHNTATMCHLMTIYNCAHCHLDTRFQCLDYKLRVEEAKRQQNLGWFSCFFPSAPITIRCKANEPERRSVLNICPECMARKDRADQELVAKKERQGRARQGEQSAEGRLQEQRSRHRCERCIAEGRHPDTTIRAANGGLCCARGLAEFAEQNRTRIPQPQGAANLRRLVRTRVEHVSEPQRMNSQQKMRNEASRAAKGYGWDRQQNGDSKYLDAGLVKQYINTPGADPRALGTGPPPPQPLYEEPRIDWEQWDASKQGPHGRLPPMPEGPLPIRPLKTRPGKNAWSIDRKPAPIAKSNYAYRYPQPEAVSPLSSAHSSPSLSSRSPVSSTGTVMSDIEEHLADALDFWQRKPLATPAPVFRPTRWT